MGYQFSQIVEKYIEQKIINSFFGTPFNCTIITTILIILLRDTQPWNMQRACLKNELQPSITIAGNYAIDLITRDYIQ